MSSTYLENLVRTRQLDRVPYSAELVLGKLQSARRRLKDAGVSQVTNETRFDAAYNAIRDLAEIGLLLQGYRTTRSGGGHHQTAIQCLSHTLQLENEAVWVIDGLRKQRHLADYEGDLVPDATLAECVRQGHALIPLVEAALAQRSD